MIKKYTIFLCFLSILIGQVSIRDVEEITNDRLDEIREELKSNPLADTKTVVKPDIETLAIEVDRERSELEAELAEVSEYFGYGYFKRKINFFDNVPTPVDFKLGAGDEIILSLWGEVNLQEEFTINKDGLIYYKNIGFINLANQTIDEAELILEEKLSQTYSTIKDPKNSTKLMLELGKLKSVNIFFSGQVANPGIHIIHPFSDIFSALVQVGGVEVGGSLRNIQLIRNEAIIHTIDFYDFFTDGKASFSKIRILEGDVIHIPPVKNRSEIIGEILNPGFYELLPGELLSDLILYAGELTSNAANNILIHTIIPIEDRTSIDDTHLYVSINLQEAAEDFIINQGSTIRVDSIRAMSTRVRLIGRVKYPGYYPASKTLREVLDLAGGFNDPLYSQSIRKDEIIILRRDASQFYGLEYKISYEDSDKFNLIPDDKVFIYEDSKYRNNPTIRIEGEVNRSGTFAFKQGMTIEDAIDLAEGLTPFANPKGILLYKEWEDHTEMKELEEVGLTHSPLIKEPILNISMDFEISKNAFIQVLPKSNTVLIEGAVYNPGLVTYTKRKSVKFYINQAGGPTSSAEFKDSYLKRINGEIITLNKRNWIGIFVEPGDTIFIPTNPDPKEFNPTEFTSDIVSILTNLATIIFIVNSNSN